MAVRTDVGYLDLAARQSGVVARAQLLSGLATQRQLERRLETGELLSIHEGVYAVRGAPATPERDLWAAVLGGGPSAVASRRSAAQLLRLRGIAPPERPEITVHTDWPLKLRGAIVHRSDSLAPPDVLRRPAAIPRTSVARTLFDLGVAVGPHAVESACIDALHRGLVSHGQLVDVLARIGGKGRPGSAAMRLFLSGSDEGVRAIESELEVRFWRLLREHGLPPPTPQISVATDRGKYRLDFGYPELMVGFELNGRAHHDGPLAMRRDRVRAAALRRAGWRLVEFGWAEVVGAPVAVAAAVSAIFGPNSSTQDGLEPKLGGGESAA